MKEKIQYTEEELKILSEREIYGIDKTFYKFLKILGKDFGGKAVMEILNYYFEPDDVDMECESIPFILSKMCEIDDENKKYIEKRMSIITRNRINGAKHKSKKKI